MIQGISERLLVDMLDHPLNRLHLLLLAHLMGSGDMFDTGVLGLATSMRLAIAIGKGTAV